MLYFLHSSVDMLQCCIFDILKFVDSDGLGRGSTPADLDGGAEF